MTKREKIYQKLKEAMKSQDKLRVEGLRYLWSLIKNREIDVKGELDDKTIEAVARSEVKKRREALAVMKKGGADTKEEEVKLEAIEEFLPEQMGEEEIGKLVNQIIGKSEEKDFGKVMGLVMGKLGGKADGKLVSELVRRELS